MTQTGSASGPDNLRCPGIDVSLDQFQWENRILVIFANHSDSDTYQAQVEMFSEHKDGLKGRDLITFSLFDEECSKLDGEIITNSSAESIRDQISPEYNTYTIYLIGKDGGTKLKKEELLKVDELFSTIDRMPMRQREMRDGSGKK